MKAACKSDTQFCKCNIFKSVVTAIHTQIVHYLCKKQLRYVLCAPPATTNAAADIAIGYRCLLTLPSVCVCGGGGVMVQPP